MKLTAAFLVLCVALLSQSTSAFFMKSVPKPEIPTVPAIPSAIDPVSMAGNLASPFDILNPLVLLKLLLARLGIPVYHLVEGSRKCVTELGPEAVGAVQSLLGVLSYLG